MLKASVNELLQSAPTIPAPFIRACLTMTLMHCFETVRQDFGSNLSRSRTFHAVQNTDRYPDEGLK